MDRERTFVWQGASGKLYRFEIVKIDEDIAVNQTGIYLFARRQPQGWEAVYIDHGELKVEIDYHINYRCVIDKSATHIHIYRNEESNTRQSIVTDLLAKHTEAYEPYGCNKRLS